MSVVYKLYVSSSAADDVAVFLRDERVSNVLVIAPSSRWTGLVETDDGPCSDVTRKGRLMARFGTLLEFICDEKGFTLHISRPDGAHLDLASSDVSRADARAMAQKVAQATSNPHVTTSLTRLLGRPFGGADTLRRLGEITGLSHCGTPRVEIEREDGQWLRVEGARIQGKLRGSSAGPGYERVGDLLADIVCDLLRRQRIDPALKQLHAYDVLLTPAHDGSLHCSAPSGLVTTTLVEALGRHRQEILTALSAREDLSH